MKVLVYGAGVIGSYLAHVLCQAGNDVTLLARGQWGQTLRQKGLTIFHHLQNETTTDYPNIVEEPGAGLYDVVFAAVQHQQLWDILDDLAQIDAPILVLVGNNLTAAEMEHTIQDHAPTPKNILFAFQVTAGKREQDRMVCERMDDGAMDIGYLDRPVPDHLKRELEALFRRTSYVLRWQDDMDSFLKCNVAAIMPMAYLAYGSDCDYSKTTTAQQEVCIDASAEGYDLLLELGYSIVPQGEDAYYRSGPQRRATQHMMHLMSKTEMGELMATAHCRHAVAEMEGLDYTWTQLRQQAPDFSMPNWDTLYAAMPDWKTLHQIYDQC
jgi:2-dehydropantoate 2-reductase